MAYPVEFSASPESQDASPPVGTPPWLEPHEDSLAPASEPHDIINARRSQIEDAEALRRARAL
jgi:hypothetical protein